MFRPFIGSSSGLYNKLESVSGLLYRPDDDLVKGRNIVAKYQIYLYLVKSYVRRHYTDT
jgi:hypothetical protein